jgi:hypothetical protein
MRRVLENRLSGVKTNQNSWQFIYSGDTSMNRVAQIANTYFDFGKPPMTQTQASETTVTYEGGGGDSGGDGGN